MQSHLAYLTTAYEQWGKSLGKKKDTSEIFSTKAIFFIYCLLWYDRGEMLISIQTQWEARMQ